MISIGFKSVYVSLAQEMNIIGAGGDGIIFVDEREPNVVTKAIYRQNEGCMKAVIEYGKQSQIYNCINCLHGCDDPLVKLINKYVRVAKPISYIDSAITINDVTYGCMVKMQKLNGLPLSVYEAYDPRIVSQIEPSYRKELDNIQAHLSYNSDITGLFGVKYSKASITRQNPPRGYFSNAETGFFKFLREKYIYKLPLSDEQLEQMIGFVYGWIFFSCEVIPLDIEFTLGLNPLTHEYELNVLDFGMTFDKRQLTNNINAFESRRFFTIYGDKTLSAGEREQELLERIIEDTGIDLYVSLDEGSVSREAFLITKNLSPCSQCKRLTFYVDLKNSVFLCGIHHL